MNNETKNIKYYVIENSQFKLDGGAMFGIIPKPLWEKVYTPDEKNRIDLSLRLMLIQTENKNILIDTGIGDYHPTKFNKIFNIIHKNNGTFENILNQINLTNEDITDLVISHLHFDHVGGILNKDKDINFKNATIHLHQNHYEYSKNATLRDKGSFHNETIELALNYYKDNNQIHFINNNESEILKDNDYHLKFLISHGHTEYMIHPYDEKFIYMADLIPTSKHFSDSWVMAYDISPGVTATEKNIFKKEILKKNLTLIFEHDNIIIGSKLMIDENSRTVLKDNIMSEGKDIYCLNNFL